MPKQLGSDPNRARYQNCAWLLLAMERRVAAVRARIPVGMLRAPGPSTPDAAPKRAARGGGSDGLRSALRPASASACFDGSAFARPVGAAGQEIQRGEMAAAVEIAQE